MMVKRQLATLKPNFIVVLLVVAILIDSEVSDLSPSNEFR